LECWNTRRRQVEYEPDTCTCWRSLKSGGSGWAMSGTGVRNGRFRRLLQRILAGRSPNALESQLLEAGARRCGIYFAQRHTHVRRIREVVSEIIGTGGHRGFQFSGCSSRSNLRNLMSQSVPLLRLWGYSMRRTLVVLVLLAATIPLDQVARAQNYDAAAVDGEGQPGETPAGGDVTYSYLCQGTS
jgi:hypothetical protein